MRETSPAAFKRTAPSRLELGCDRFGARVPRDARTWRRAMSTFTAPRAQRSVCPAPPAARRADVECRGRSIPPSDRSGVGPCGRSSPPGPGCGHSLTRELHARGSSTWRAAPSLKRGRSGARARYPAYRTAGDCRSGSSRRGAARSRATPRETIPAHRRRSARRYGRNLRVEGDGH
jgi:hypothetical protein